VSVVRVRAILNNEYYSKLFINYIIGISAAGRISQEDDGRPPRAADMIEFAGVRGLESNVRRAKLVLIHSLLASALLSACSIDRATAPSPISRGPLPPPQQPLPPTSATCDASQAQFAVGERASDELLERGRTAAGAAPARYIRPNQPITTEFLGSRLNLNLNDKDVVVSVSCG
jgi:hypothetical protein